MPKQVHNTSVIGPGETPLGKKALEKPSSILNQQGKKLDENNISTPCTACKKSLEKPSAISKLQEEKLIENKSSTPPNQQILPHIFDKIFRLRFQLRSLENFHKDKFRFLCVQRFFRKTIHLFLVYRFYNEKWRAL
jgi:hypothetical protein